MRNEELGISYLLFVICALYSVLCTLYIEVCNEELLMGEGMVGCVVEIPREADVGEGALQYINGKLGFIVC